MMIARVAVHLDRCRKVKVRGAAGWLAGCVIGWLWWAAGQTCLLPLYE
jgi:hypothetical protein